MTLRILIGLFLLALAACKDCKKTHEVRSSIQNTSQQSITLDFCQKSKSKEIQSLDLQPGQTLSILWSSYVTMKDYERGPMDTSGQCRPQDEIKEYSSDVSLTKEGAALIKLCKMTDESAYEDIIYALVPLNEDCPQDYVNVTTTCD